MGTVSSLLPDFPWDTLRPYVVKASEHPDGGIEMSMGTPTDPTPEVIQEALAKASNAPGYPLTAGSADLRETIVDYLLRKTGCTQLSVNDVFPTVGSKEFVASLPKLLGLGANDVVVTPRIAYPTYEVGVRLAGAQLVRADSLTEIGPAKPALLWLNSPSNPTGQVLPPAHLRKVVEWARERGTIVASDECYFELGWDAEPVSILDPVVNGGSLEGILAVHSLSKRSNMGGYRAGFVAGDPAITSELLAVRKHSGGMVPNPVQAAMAVALGNEGHVAEQRDRYAARRIALRTALSAAGFTIDHSNAGLYLWVRREEDGWQAVEWFAERGLVVCPGSFYGEAGAGHVRISLTASDQETAAAVSRIIA